MISREFIARKEYKCKLQKSFDSTVNGIDTAFKNIQNSVKKLNEIITLCGRTASTDRVENKLDEAMEAMRDFIDMNNC